MKPKVFINIGLPKTSSTNMQTNFYPYIKNVNYLGRKQGHGLDDNTELFKEFNIYIEGGELATFNKERFEKLKIDFKKNLIKKNNLISMENWAFPYQRNNQTNEVEFVSQFEKLERLNNFSKEIEADFNFFLIHRKPVDGIVSLFMTAQNRIEKIYGYKCLEFKKFLDKYENKDNDYEKIKLFFDVYNLDKIKKAFFGSKLKIFEYEDIKTNPKKFIENFFKYLDMETDLSLVDNITRKTGVSPRRNGLYFVKKPNLLFIFLKKLIPQFIKKRFGFLISFSFLNKILTNEVSITEEDKIRLKKLLVNEK